MRYSIGSARPLKSGKPLQASSLLDSSLLDIVKDPQHPHGYPHFAGAKSLGHIPGNSGFFAGINTGLKFQREGVRHILRQKMRYGNVYRDQLGAYPMVVVAGHELVGQILRNEDQLWSAGLAVGRLSDGLSFKIDPEKRVHLLGTDFSTHRLSRKMVQPAFSNAAMSGYISIIQQCYQSQLSGWGPGRKIKFKTEIRRLMSELSTKLLLGVEQPSDAALIEKTTKDYWSALYSVVRHPLLNPAWRRGIDSVETLRTAIGALRAARRNTGGGSDLFSHLCRIQSQTEGLEDDPLIELMFGILFAAFDTTALGLSGMAYLLARHPRWQERLREEIMAMPKRPSLSDLQAMQQTDLVWKEALRLFPVVSNVTRVSMRTTQLEQYTLPPATLVLLSTGALGFDSGFWSNPEMFDPERFSPQRAEDKGHRHLYLPFGHGAHICVGAQLATLEMKLFWVELIPRYRFRLAKDYDAGHQLTPLGSVSGQVELVMEAL